MDTITYNGTSYNRQDLFKTAGKELVKLHNELAVKANKDTTKRFSTIGAGVDRTWSLLELVGEAAPSKGKGKEKAAATVAEAAPAPASKLGTSPNGGSLGTVAAPKGKAGATPKRRESDKPAPRRGTNLAAPGFAPIPCREGSKQAVLLDKLCGSNGATMAELLDATKFGNKPWTEASVRSGFGWDMKQKGYGVRSEFDANGVERFHIVLPVGHQVAKHTPLKGVPKADARQTKLPA